METHPELHFQLRMGTQVGLENCPWALDPPEKVRETPVDRMEAPPPSAEQGFEESWLSTSGTHVPFSSL